ncbi:MAG TPA: L,D-transpeptidase family protein [Xanthobacteraceae bacterium]|jgi:hypothetical protein
MLALLRAALVSGSALGLLAGLGSPADAGPRGSYFSPYGWYGGGWFLPPASAPGRRARRAPNRAETLEPAKDAGFGDMPKGPLQIVVSIDDQKVTLFSNGARVAQGPVSTGVPGHPTPMGIFSIIEKDRYHHSNIYSAAPMPYMQRITWSGVALHEGVLPGYPASHGCIRMSHDFARKLWPITKLGIRVIVARNQVTPVAFEHPKLFAPKLKPEAPQIAAAGISDERPQSAIRVAQVTPTGGDREASDAVPDVPPIESAPGSGRGRNSAIGSPQAAQVEPLATSAQGNRAIAQSRPGEEVSSPGNSDVGAPATTADPPKPIAPRLKAADQPAKRSGQIAVFVSRKEMKMFVRQGFIPLFDVPITIDEPDRPLGTHVFTAMGTTDDGAGMRWNLMSIPTDPSPRIEPRDGRRKFKEQAEPIVHLKRASSAAEALDRIHFPKEAADRVDELLIPGSSLVVSDEGLGRETGRYTEFIVLTR